MKKICKGPIHADEARGSIRDTTALCQDQPKKKPSSGRWDK